jgi:hypothetical protein
MRRALPRAPDSLSPQRWQRALRGSAIIAERLGGTVRECGIVDLQSFDETIDGSRVSYRAQRDNTRIGQIWLAACLASTDIVAARSLC